MREILFKAKRIDSGEWVYGLFARCKMGNLTLPCIERERENDSGDYIEIAIVNGETLGQYTGLKDKSKNKIFEGDILDCEDRIVKVSWNEFNGTWDSVFIKYTERKLKSNGIIVADWKFKALVIGNIHDEEENNAI